MIGVPTLGRPARLIASLGAAAILGDVATTYVALELTTGHAEADPVQAAIFSAVGIALGLAVRLVCGVLLLLLTLALAEKLRGRPRDLGLALVAAGVLETWLIVADNLRVLL